MHCHETAPKTASGIAPLRAFLASQSAAILSSYLLVSAGQLRSPFATRPIAISARPCASFGKLRIILRQARDERGTRHAC